MHLSSLHLQNFRSYEKQSFNFSVSTTLLLGHNTAGKTNVLEAVMFLATGKSFRADYDREVIDWTEELARLRGKIFPTLPSMVDSEGRKNPPSNQETELEVVITTGQVQGQKTPIKKFLVNGVPRRLVDFVGNLRAVLFWPHDLELITESPSLRRKYLDTVLSLADREYRRNLISYERGLRQRNSLLDAIHEGKAKRSQLLFWNQLLIKAGQYLTDAREEYITYVNGQQEPIHDYSVIYDKSIISEARLDMYGDQEIAAKVTLVGPHRDDFDVYKRMSSHRVEVSDISISTYGSRGEQRLGVLWLKLAELEYIHKKTHERPLLLLDDIFSEFDRENQRHILDVVGKQQTIITSAEPDLVQSLQIPNAEVIQLR